MKTVGNVELFNELLNKYLNKNYINNGSRLIRDYRSLIEKNSLCYTEGENYILFFEDCREFYNLYYFMPKLNPSLDRLDLNLNRTIVADVIYTGSNSEEASAHLLKADFKKYLTRSYRTLKLKPKDVKVSGSVKFAVRDEAVLIFKLQNKYIDKYTGNILTKEEILNAAERNLILCIHEGNNLAGYLRFAVNNKNVSLEGIAVDGKFRGKGYSKKLVEFFIDYFSSEGYNKIDLWVRDDNISAIKLYDFFDFKNTKYKCDNYIYG